MKHFHPDQIPEKVKEQRDQKMAAYKFITDKGLWREFQAWEQKDKKEELLKNDL